MDRGLISIFRVNLLLCTFFSVLLFTASPVHASLYTPQIYFKHGAVYARDIVRNDNGDPIYVEYDESGKEVLGGLNVIDTQDDDYRVVSGVYYQTAVAQYQAVRSTYLQSGMEAPLLLDRNAYLAGVYTTVDGDSIDIDPSVVHRDTVKVLVAPPSARYSTDPEQLLLRQFDVDPEYGLHSETHSLLLKLDLQQPGDIVSGATVVAESTNNIGYRVGFFGDGTTVSDSLFRDYDDDIYGPLKGVPVRLDPHLVGAAITDEEGKYRMQYYLPPCPGFTFEYTTPVSIELYYKRFNPQAGPTMPYYLRKYDWDFCNGLAAYPPGYSLTGLMTQISVAAIIATSAIPAEPRIDFPIDLMVLSGRAALANSENGAPLPLGSTGYDGSRAALERVAQQQYDLDGDGQKDLALLGEWIDEGEGGKKFDTGVTDPGLQGVWLSSLHGAITVPPVDTDPDLTRLADWSTDFEDRALLSGISADDLQNTDIYVFRESDGSLIMERVGLEENERLFGVDNGQGKFFYTIRLVGSRGRVHHMYRNLGYEGEFAQWQQDEGVVDGSPLYSREADHLRPGENVRLIAINRAGGYLGSLTVPLQAAGNGSTELDISFDIDDIQLLPPNLKVWAERRTRTELGLTRGEVKQYRIGNEGAGMSDDEFIVIFTEWLDPQGYPLPAELDDYGYTARLAKVTGDGASATLVAESFVENFPIRTGPRMQLVQLPNSGNGNQHYYIQISGEPNNRDPNFSSSGMQGGILSHRADKFVPVLAPIFDETGTDLSLQAWRQASQYGALLHRPDPVYQWAYRPEFQFSVYDLQMREITRQSVQGNSEELLYLEQPVISVSDALIELAYSLEGPTQWGSAISPLDAYAFDDEKELVLSFGEQEVAAVLDTDGNVTVEDVSLLSSLRQEDHITLRLYANNDTSNVLWEWVARAKLFENVTKNLFVKKDIDILNERICLAGSAFQFYLMRPATVNLRFEPEGNAGGSEYTVLDNVPLQAGSYIFPISSNELEPGEYRSTLTGIESSTGYTELENGAALSELTTQDRLPVGHTIVKGVDLYDGHLTHSRQDFAIAGRGKSLDFTRSYGSNADGVPGVLGVGWSHNWDTRIVTRCGEYIVIGAEGGGIRFVEDVEGNFTPLKGYHGTLIRDGGNFDFYPKGGIQYHYTKEAGETEWRLAYVKDTNGNTTSLSYEHINGRRHLNTVTDSSARVLTFEYTQRDFPASHLVGDFPVLSKISGPGGISVEFAYDDFGNLISADRDGGARVEGYAYNTADNETPLLSRHKLMGYTDPNGGQTTYTYNDKTITVHPDGGVILEMPYRAVTAVSEPTGISTGFGYSEAFPSTETVVTDPNGNGTAYALNHYGSALSIADPIGTTAMSWSDSDVVMLSRTDANGVTTEYTYDEHANLLSEATGGYTRSYTYATIAGKPWIKNRRASQTDRNGHTTTYSHDGSGNLVEVTDASGGTVTHSYNGLGDRISTQDANGHTTTYAYDAYGNPAAVTDPQGNVTAATWDERSRKLSDTDANGGTTQFGYDTLDNPVQRTDALSGNRSYSYDAMGHKLSETDELGHTVSWHYDGLGRVVSTTNAAGNTLSFSYDGNGNKLSESDWLGNVTSFSYDGGNRLVQRSEPLGRITAYAYDAVGNLTAETDANGHITSHSYDSLNRRVKTTDALGGIRAFGYDGENLISETDALGRITTYSYDSLNRRIKVTDAASGITATAYDAVGNVLSVTDANGHVRSFSYDAADRKIGQTDAEGGTTAFSYDGNGNLLSQTDARGNTTAYAYDALNRKTKTLDAVGAVTTYTYDAVGNLLEEGWPNSNTVSHSYDVLNRLTQSSDTLGTLAAYSYDANGNKTAQTDANGNTTHHAYDALNRLTQTTLASQHTLGYGYDTLGNKTAETDANGNTTHYAYDTLNRVTQITDPLGQTLSYSYDAVGNTLSETDKRGNTSTSTYDALNRVTQVTDPLGQTLSYSYDAVSNKLSETDKRGTATVFTYDGENRLLSTTKAGVPLAARSYDAVGNLLSDTDANGNTVSFTYDARNRLIRSTSALGHITQHTYDAIGDKLTTTDPDGHTTTWSYDKRRRSLSKSNPAGETTGYGYDGNGNRTGMTRPGGNAWQYGYDALNRLTSVTDPLGGVTRYSYDGNGNRLTQQDAGGNTTSHQYDALNRKVAVTHADGAGESYSYDANANLTGLLDAKGQSLSYSYDALNRRIAASYPNSGQAGALLSITTVYDANNNPTSHTESYAEGSERTTAKVYDNFDRLTQETDGFGRTIAYSYDANGNRTGLNDPDGLQTGYSFDADNRLIKVSTAAGVTSYSYDGTGRITKIVNPNGIITRQSRDAAGRLTAISHGTESAVLPGQGDGEPMLAAYSYTYDANGNRLSQSESQNGVTEQTAYSYDSADRLTRVTYADKSVSYTYDANYNRLTEKTTATDGTLTASLSLSYNSRNQLTAITDELDAAKSISYQYDANGNQTLKSKNGVITTFIYDARDKLVSVQEAQTTLGRFRYDYQGMRIEKQGADGLRRYSYDGDSVLTQADESGNTVAKYEYGPERLLSLNNTGEGRRYYHHDALGSVIALSDSSGQSGAAYRYDAWGKARETSGESANPFGFTGHEKDSETGLYYFKARFYDPDTARFLSQDSYLGEGETPPSLHRYLYAYANPTVYVDLTGYASIFRDASNELDNFNEYLDERMSQYDSGSISGVAGAVSTGTTKFVATLGQGILLPLDYIANGYQQIAGAVTGTDYSEAARDIKNTHKAIDRTYDYVMNGGLVTSAKNIVSDASDAISTGETGAISRTTQHFWGLLTFKEFAKGSPKAVVLAETGNAPGIAARVSTKIAGLGNAAKNTATKTVAAIKNVAGKLKQAAVDGRFNPLNYQPELGTLGMNGVPLKFKGVPNKVSDFSISSSTQNLRAVAAGVEDLTPAQAKVLSSLDSGFGAETTILKKGFGNNDLAALSAATGDEFAMFTTGGRRLIVRGDAGGVPIGTLDGSAQRLADQGWRFSSHVHPDGSLMSSVGDRNVLSVFSNSKSAVLDPYGGRGLFNSNGDMISSGWLPQ